MIPRECKRLAEVDFPVAEVSKHSAREKSIRHGHPSTLHLWWARRPLAACRAMLIALLLPDPCDQHCPAKFKEQARCLLLPVPMIGSTHTDEELQKALFKFIADFSNWDNSANQTYLACARGLVKAAYGEQSPLVADSFAGGGSIPLEALRVGCDAFANDLNPVACLLDRILIQDVSRYGHDLVSRIEDASAQLKEYLRKEVGPLYLTDSNAILSTAYLWAREVRCEQPKCGAAIPLLRTLWLSRSEAQPQALRINVNPVASGIPEIELDIFSPNAPEVVSHGTIMGGNAVCPACSKPLRRSRIEAQLKAQRGGADSARLVAVMVSSEDGRHFRPPTREDLKANAIAREIDRDLHNQTYSEGLTVIPQEALNSVRPSPNARGLSAVTRYGMMQFADCHLARQRVTLAQITKFLRALPKEENGIGAAVKRSLLVLLGRCVDRWSSCCRLDSTRDTVTGSFSKQALQLVWDFCEANPFSEWSGGLDNSLQWIVKVLERTGASLETGGDVHLGDARALPLPDESAQVWFTDPPYYDSVPYADLSDFFYCWLRRAASDDPEFRDPWDHENSLTPKLQECVWNQAYAVDGKFKDSVFFELCVGSAFSEGRRILQEDGIGCIVFAHKTTEGWEALLRGIIGSRLVITSSWPIQTEMKSRTAARDAASLMGSIHLVCRRRSANAPIGDWGAVLQQLPGRIGDWMEKLSGEGIRGADLVFSCIGPALELFSRYDKVETAEGREVKLDEFLEKVWEVVGRSALQQVLGTAEARARNGAAAAIEEDARLTALFLWTLQSAVKPNGNGEETEETDEDEGDKEGAAKPKKGYILIYDVVRRFAQPLGIHLEHWDGRIIETKKGIVRLIPVLEREEQLFGTSGTNAVARALERTGGREPQYMLFPEEPDTTGSPKRGKGSRKGRGAKREDGEALAPRREATTLDRIHAAILLQARGEATALRALLQAEIERSPDFLRLANALSALYPKDSEEKRLLDAMLLAVPR
jgi:putative DNA methylase